MVLMEWTDMGREGVHWQDVVIIRVATNAKTEVVSVYL